MVVRQQYEKTKTENQWRRFKGCILHSMYSYLHLLLKSEVVELNSPDTETQERGSDGHTTDLFLEILLTYDIYVTASAYTSE